MGEGVGVGAELAEGAAGGLAVGTAGAEAGAPLPPGALGLVVISMSCVPAGMGPPGLAGQDPGGLTGALMPNGMVPGDPTKNPPTNVCRLAPWNWHWNNPLSSLFLGAC